MLVDAMGVFLPDDPDGNAKLVFSILDCLPKANRVSIDYLNPAFLSNDQHCSTELLGTHHGSFVQSDSPVLKKQNESTKLGYMLCPRAHDGL